MVKGYTIKEFCKEDRPREKLKKYGAFSLSDKEVLAILLRTGTKNKNVIELASSILEDVGGITKLRETTFNELAKHKGIGEEKAIHILANIEFARRIYSTDIPDIKCNSPEVPSGDPTPSIEDLLTTINLLEVGDVVGIEMLDHIVVAKEGYVSIRKILNYFNLENMDYKNKEITREQLQFILKKYKIVNNF